MKRGFYDRNGYGLSTVAVVQPKRVARTYVQLARSKGRGYYSTAAQRYAGAYGRPGLLGLRPDMARFSGATPELKFFDTTINFTTDATAEIPPTGQLCLIPQDDTQSGRDGNKAIVKSIHVHGVAQFDPSTSALAATVVYMYIIQDTQCNGAAPAVGDANVGIFTSANLRDANHTIANGNRFRVLKKWVWAFNSPAGVSTAYNRVVKPFSWHGKCNIPLQYDAASAGGALTTIRSNNIFIVAGSDGQSDDLVAVQGVCRLRFTD